ASFPRGSSECPSTGFAQTRSLLPEAAGNRRASFICLTRTRAFCSRPGNLLGEKGHDVVDSIWTKRLAIVIRHEGLVVKYDLLQVRFIEHVQMSLCVDDLDGVVGVVSGHTLEFHSIFPGDAYRLKSYVGRGIGVDNRLAQLLRGHTRSDVAQV